jgi:hypothetical protein
MLWDFHAAAYGKIEARQAAMYYVLIKDRVLDRIP